MTFVEQRKEEHGLNTTSTDLVEKYNDEFGGDKSKDLKSLKSLENKKLLKSKKSTGSEFFFFPPK